MNSLLDRVRVAALEYTTHAVCVGPSTYHKLVSLMGSVGEPYFISHTREGIVLFGKPLFVIVGIPQDEIVVSSKPPVAGTFRSIPEWRRGLELP